MAYTYEEVIPSLIENTTMYKKINSLGVHTTYAITACGGYVLHDKFLDSYESYDSQGNGIGEPILGYYAGTRTVAASYDFTANPREFYAVLETDVPANQIFNVPSGTPEVM